MHLELTHDLNKIRAYLEKRGLNVIGEPEQIVDELVWRVKDNEGMYLVLSSGIAIIGGRFESIPKFVSDSTSKRHKIAYVRSVAGHNMAIRIPLDKISFPSVHLVALSEARNQ